jgi:hypothetical protein
VKTTEQRLKRVFVGAACFAAGGVLPAAHAAWDTVPVVGLSTEVDDNARLVLADQPSSSRTALDARYRLRAFGSRGEAFIEPRIVTDSYADPIDEELESDDLFLLTRAIYDFGETNIEFQSDYRRESVLRSEIADAIGEGPDLGPEPIDTGAGTLGTFTDERERLDLAFNAEFALSQRTNFRLETSRIDVAYPDSLSTTRTPFDNNTLAAVLTRLVDERNEVSARIYFSDFHAVRNDNNTNAWGVQGAFTRPVSETWTFLFNAGIARTDYSFLRGATGTRFDNADNSFTFDIGFDKRSQRTQWTIGVGRAIVPNSNGFLSQRDDAQIRVAHQFTPRVSAAAGVRGSRIDTVAEAAGDNERDYVRSSVELAWAMTPRWRLTTGLDRVSMEFVDAGGAKATSNMFSVGVRYEGLSQQGAPARQR